MKLVRNLTTGEKLLTQVALNRLGFYHGELDGIWGMMTSQAMADWQQAHAFPIADGIPTWPQLVVLGAVKPEVLPAKRSSSATGNYSLLAQLLPAAVGFIMSLLPKVYLPMNPVLLALGRMNKATVASIVGFIATITLLFGFEISPDMQGILVTVGAALLTGLTTFLVPNAPPSPLKAAALLQDAIASSTPQEYLEYAQTTWPSADSTGLAGGTTSGLTGGGHIDYGLDISGNNFKQPGAAVAKDDADGTAPRTGV